MPTQKVNRMTEQKTDPASQHSRSRLKIQVLESSIQRSTSWRIGVRSRQDCISFSVPTPKSPGYAQLASFPWNTRAIFPRSKEAERKSDNSPYSNTGFNEMLSFNSTSSLFVTAYRFSRVTSVPQSAVNVQCLPVSSSGGKIAVNV